MNKNNSLINKLEKFISKFYQNQLIKGLIFYLSSFILFLIFFSSLEYFARFDKEARGILFWLFVIINVVVLWKWIVTPIMGLTRLRNSMSHQEAAKIIGSHFGGVKDKLLNILQLQELSDKDNALIQASIDQKTNDLDSFKFSNAVKFKHNVKYLKYALFPVAILLIFLLSGNEKVILESSERIISYNTDFIEQAPFEFVILNNDLSVIRGEDFVVKLKTLGEKTPSQVYFKNGNNTFLMSAKDEIFEYRLKNVMQNTTFRFEANSFVSSSFELTSIPKPLISKLIVKITPPIYLNKKPIEAENKGNLYIFEGSRVEWLLESENTNQILIGFENNFYPLKKKSNNVFSFSKKLVETSNYHFITSNSFTKGDSLFYTANVIKDAYPSIVIRELVDSINPSIIFISGQIEDDHGISKLSFNYKSISDTSSWKKEDIFIQKKQKSQLFSYLINFDELGISPGQGTEYFFEVWDNDQVNGEKASRTSKKQYLAPSIEELELEVSQQNETLKNKIEKTQQLAKDIQNDLKELKKQLLNKKEISWEEKNRTQELLKKQKELENNINEIEKLQSINQDKDDKLSEKSQELLKKQEQIQQLFENIMDEEMKQMMDELNKMMDDVNKEDLKNMLDKMEQNDENIEKELDRTLELFKQLEIEQKLEKNANKLLDLAQKQKDLSIKNKEKSISNDSIQKEQQKLQNEFEKISKELEQIQKQNQELENKKSIPNTEDLEKSIEQDMQKSLEKLNNKLKKQSSQLQQDAAQKMEQMSQEITDSMEMEEAESVAEDMETLRQILENLISVSHDQESLMKNLYNVQFNSPIYTQHLRTQKTLQQNTQIIEDSLLALSKRQPSVESIINKEINAMNSNMENALSFMEERSSSQATEKQQFAMMAANNLALLLSEVLERMQKQMANMNTNPSGKMCNKPKSVGGESMKKMKQMQQQIKKQMKSMLQGQKGKKGQKKKGGERSQKIAQMAAQQEQIRNRLNELRNELSGDKESKNNIDKLLDQINKNQDDILNDNISQSTIQRQEQILTRLLQAEKAEMEREREKQRESNEWLNNLSKKILDPMDKYKKEKQNQQELIRTIPPSLTPFYKDKVNQYFKNER
ncbi:MAG: hypothetical protein ACON4E_07735 [Flavobacteriales bacterium]